MWRLRPDFAFAAAAEPAVRRPGLLRALAARPDAWLQYLWRDHVFLRTGFSNAHWLDGKMLRCNQPGPLRLARLKAIGIRTVINLRGTTGAFYAAERQACRHLGLRLVTFRLTSRSLPRSEEFVAAKRLFEGIEYPAVLHCKSGADRAGLMSALYCHLHLGQPISVAREQLGLQFLHLRWGSTGVLDHLFDVYEREVEPVGTGFLEWVTGPDYDFQAVRDSFRPTWWGETLTRRVLRRE